MAEIALNAGFQSIRQFNHTVRTRTGQSPSDWRRLCAESQAAPRTSAFVMRLSYRPPIQWSALMAFLSVRTTPGVELAGEASYQRTVEWEGPRARSMSGPLLTMPA